MCQHDDLEKVRELYNRYAIGWDENRPDELAECFTPDGVFESYRGRFVGREAILGNLADYNRSVGPGRKQRHLTTNVSVHLDGDRATGTAYLIFCVGHEGTIELTAFGHYCDELRKVDGRWYFTSRAGLIEGQTVSAT